MPLSLEEQDRIFADIESGVVPKQDIDIDAIEEKIFTNYDAINNDEVATENNDLGGMTEREALGFAMGMGTFDTYRGLKQIFGIDEEEMRLDQKRLNAIFKNKDYGGKALAVYMGGVVADPFGWVMPIAKAKSISSLIKQGAMYGTAFGATSYVDEQIAADSGISELEQRGRNAAFGGVGGTAITGLLGVVGRKKLNFDNPPVSKQEAISRLDKQFKDGDLNEDTYDMLVRQVNNIEASKATERNLSGLAEQVSGTKNIMSKQEGDTVLTSFKQSVARPTWERMRKNPLSFAFGGYAGSEIYEELDNANTSGEYIANGTMTILGALAGYKIGKVTGQNQITGKTGNNLAEKIKRGIYPETSLEKELRELDLLHLRGLPEKLHGDILFMVKEAKKLPESERKLLHHLYAGDITGDELVKLSKGEEVTRTKFDKISETNIPTVQKLAKTKTVLPVQEFLEIDKLPKNIDVLLNLNEKNKKVIKEIGDELVNAGVLDKDIFYTNIDNYYNRYYQAIVDKKGVKAGDQFKKNLLAIRGEGLKDRGMTFSFKNKEDAIKYAKAQTYINKQDPALVKNYGKKYSKELENLAGSAADFTGKYGQYINKIDESDIRFNKNKINTPNWGVTVKKKGNTYDVITQLNSQTRRELGEMEDIAQNIYRTGAVTVSDAGMGAFLKSVANKYRGTKVFGETDDLSKYQGGELITVPNIKIPGSDVKKYGMLAGKQIDAKLFDDIDLMVNVTRGDWINKSGIRNYLKVLRAWKATKTVLHPMVHSNNFLSNAPMYYLEAGWSKGSREALKEAFADTPIIFGRMRGKVEYKDLPLDIKKMTDYGVFQSDFVNVDLAKYVDMDAYSKIYSGIKITDDTNFMQIGKELSQRSKNFYEKYKGIVAEPYKFLQDIYQMEDRVWRYALYKAKKREGFSDFDAANMAINKFVDYNIKSPTINFLRNTGMPFLSYPYRMLPNLIEGFVTNPERAAVLAATIYVANDLSRGLGTDDSSYEEDYQRQLMPKYLQKEAFGLPFMPYANIRLPYDGKNGGAKYFDYSRKLPGGDVFETTSMSGGAIPSIPPTLQPGGPLIDIANKLIVGRDGFTGQEYSPADDTLMYRAKKYAQGFLPNLGFITGTPAYEKFQRILNKRGPLLNDPLTFGEGMFNQVIGGINTADIARLKILRGKEKQRLVTKFNKAKKDLRNQYYKGLIDREELEQLLKEKNEELRKELLKKGRQEWYRLKSLPC